MVDVVYNIDNGAYEPKTEYPSLTSKPQIGRFPGGSKGAREYADALEAYEKIEADIKKARAKYQREKSDLQNQFKLDLEEENGIPNDHPKAEVLFGMAWEDGHDEGLINVMYKYEKYSQLLTK